LGGNNLNLSEVAKLIYPYIGENYPKGADFLVALLDSIFGLSKTTSCASGSKELPAW
jgi:hypothetical protein